MIATLKKLIVAYIASWLFLAWTVTIFCAGAATMYVAVVGAVPQAVRDRLL